LILSTVLPAIAGLPGNWEVRNSAFAGNLTGIATAPGQLVAVGQGGAIFHSGDGVSWVRADFNAATGDFHCTTFGKGLYVAGGTLGCLMAISPDGVNWTNIQSTGSIHANFGVTFARGRFVAVGRGTSPIPNSRLLTSTDGIVWETVVRPTTNTLRAVTFGNGKYVAVGDGGTIITSPDALDWTVQFSGTEHHLRSVTFTGREFLAGGDSSILLTSEDGLSWLTVPFSSFDVRGLASCGTAVVSVGGLGTAGRVQASSDGLSWPGSPVSLPAALNAVVQFDLGRFIAVGNNGLIVDSIAWADAPVNVWTKATNGHWHEAFWSLGHIPSWKDRSIVFTNAGSKTLEIDSTAPRDYPESMLINELVLNAPEGAHNTLSLNNAGVQSPLLINTGLRVPPNVSVLNVNSALEAPGLNLSGEITLTENGSFLFRDVVSVGVIGTGLVNQTSGAFAAERVNLGVNFPGTWNQLGGTHEAGTLALGRGSVYHLHKGLLMVHSDLQLGYLFSQVEPPQFNITNASVVVGKSLYVGVGEVRFSGGTLTTSNTTITAGIGDSTARMIQTAGEHRVQNELDVQGTYEVRGGGLMFKTLRLQGQLTLNGGWNGNADLAFHGGILKANQGHYFNRLSLPSNGTIDFQEQSADIRFMFTGAWAGTLSLTNWTPGHDKLIIGYSALGLSAEQLSQIRFINPGGFPPGIYSARITSSGEVVPVPRLAYQRGGNNLMLAWPQGYRLLSATNVAGPYSLMTNAISPYPASYTDPQRFFILRNEN